jgi:hypothetical protein
MLPTRSSLIHQKGEQAVSAEANKALLRRFVDEVQGAGNIDLIDGICSPELVNHTPRQGYLQRS